MKKKVIIVEDDAAILDALQMILERAGYEVILFGNGGDLMNGGFEAPSIFLIDKQLSGMDGLDICTYLKSNAATADIPVLMLSASPHVERMAKNAGANGFLEKPFSKFHLLQAMENLLRIHMLA